MIMPPRRSGSPAPVDPDSGRLPASHANPLLAIIACVPAGVLGESAGTPQRAEAVLHALVGEPAGAVPRIDRHPAHRVDRQPSRAPPPCRTAAYTCTGALTLRNAQRPRSRSSTSSSSPAAVLVAAVSSASPPDAAPETRAARLTVAPNQSPWRSTAGPVCMPTRTRGKPCWAPTSCTMHSPSRIAAAASPVRSISASPIVLTSWADGRPAAGARPHRTRRPGRRPARPRELR
jgi:hypothetical protein